jgi:hypothetical protein
MITNTPRMLAVAAATPVLALVSQGGKWRIDEAD